MCQQINKTKNTADKQLTSIVAAVDNICKKRQKKKNFHIHGELAETNKVLRFFSEGVVI